jgi:septum formation protein
MHVTVPLCLASSSPRRQEFLRRMNFEFESNSPDVDESRLPGEEINEFLLRVSLSKAHAVTPAQPDALVLAGDTVVVVDDEVLGKPRNPEHAREMLYRLEGRWHEVRSAYVLEHRSQQEMVSGLEVTRVCLFPLSSQLIDWYVSTGEGVDKAGSYAIQGLGTCLVERIEGSYTNVMGFPIERILRDMEVKGWLSFSQESA